MIIETERSFLREMNMNDYDSLYAVLADSWKQDLHCESCRRIQTAVEDFMI